MPEVTVLIPSLLRPLTGGQEQLRLDVGGGATVAELLDAIGGGFPTFGRRVRDETGALRRFVNIYLDGDDVRRMAGLATPVAAGQELMIIQSVAGG
ncbi:molybdopterin converting factor small subunit [Arthrobacter silviterrae]|uniref:MoaD/ThiS family protein n=1 Tax=Arthrobacter silviterrae TaxID=2026658 RepID=A0ABX0DG59_9MICC|nr:MULTISPECIES: MoaD/ThiS family protein [Arthrobacter]MCU6482325.1 MoaD/ThiS family protein [Arthrobacter sp. A2-55]MDQ0278167.1 molybdopterin converting factor small subunit [Arthrobacter silviterrae]NGN84369.1 MoaD/ThiS family protein [Arthrobacter silviterrae]